MAESTKEPVIEPEWQDWKPVEDCIACKKPSNISVQCPSYKPVCFNCFTDKKLFFTGGLNDIKCAYCPNYGCVQPITYIKICEKCHTDSAVVNLGGQYFNTNRSIGDVLTKVAVGTGFIKRDGTIVKLLQQDSNMVIYDWLKKNGLLDLITKLKPHP